VLEWTTPTLLAKIVGAGHPNTFFPTLFGNLLSESTVPYGAVPYRTRYHLKDELDVFPYDLYEFVYIMVRKSAM